MTVCLPRSVFRRFALSCKSLVSVLVPRACVWYVSLACQTLNSVPGCERRKGICSVKGWPQRGTSASGSQQSWPLRSCQLGFSWKSPPQSSLLLSQWLLWLCFLHYTAVTLWNSSFFCWFVSIMLGFPPWPKCGFCGIRNFTFVASLSSVPHNWPLKEWIELLTEVVTACPLGVVPGVLKAPLLPLSLSGSFVPNWNSILRICTTLRHCPRQSTSSKSRRPLSPVIYVPRSVLLGSGCLLTVFGSCGLDLQTSSIQLSFLTDLLLRPRAMFSSLTNLTTASSWGVSALMKRRFAAFAIMMSNTR